MWLEEKKYEVGKTDFNPLIAFWMGFGVTMGIIIVLINILDKLMFGSIGV
jgi:hypothetical protein